MALSKIDIENMVTGETPVANGGTGQSTLAAAGLQRPSSKPIIINGDMAIAQRSTSVTGITSDGYQTCDRIRPSFTGGGIGTYTFIQESLTSGNAFANGFTKAFRLDCTTADSSPASGDYFYLAYKIEGNNLQAFKKGTTNAQKMTLDFWVKSNKTGTAQVNMNDQDNTRMCSGTYAISSADTWEHKVINIAADTTGAFGNDTGNSMQIEWWVDGGSNFQGGAVPTAWEARSNTDRGVSDLAIADNTANDFAITGIQLEVGEYSSTTLPPFQHESYGDNLSRCQRYFLFTGDGSAYQSHGTGVEVSSTSGYCNVPLSSTMRATPSVTKEDALVIFDGNGESAVTGIGNIYYGKQGTILQVAVNCSGGGLSDNAGLIVYSTNDSSSGFLIDAEL